MTGWMLRIVNAIDDEPMTPVRVAVGMSILAGVFGFLVGAGASPWFLLTLPVVFTCCIYANRRQ